MGNNSNLYLKPDPYISWSMLTGFTVSVEAKGRECTKVVFDQD
jgi:hypothetical protein